MDQLRACMWFNDSLEHLLDDTLSAAERATAEAHAAVCPRCQELYALMRGTLDGPSVETPAGLTESILARTSGRPCEHAVTRLGEQADGMLDGLDRELVEAHLGTCGDCARLVSVLRRLGDDLPAFAELRPDAALVGDVLALTRPRPSRAVTVLDNLRAVGRRLFARPRIAWEAGYVAAMVVWLVFGASWSPLRAAPVQAMALIQQSASDTRSAGVSAIEAINLRLAALSERIVADGAAELNGSSAGFVAVLSGRYRRAAEAAPDLDQHWRQFAAAVLDRDIFSGVDALRSLGRDVGTVLTRFLLRPASTTDSGSSPE